MKKTICLITNWYPTKENPFQGLFFKEQAFAVEEAFDFVVVHYSERFRRKPFQAPVIAQTNRERNTVEYTIDAYVPPYLYLNDEINTFTIRHFKKDQLLSGTGKYISKERIDFTKRNLISAFEKDIPYDIDAFYCVDAQKEAFYTQCLANHFHKPYVIGEHAPVPWPGSLLTDINKNAIEKADLFLAISNDKIRQLMLQNIHLPKTRYIGNLVDESRFLLKQSNNTIKTFIIVASHSYYKNYHLFIDIMNRLTEISISDFRVMIVGYGANKGYASGVEEFEEEIRNTKFADKTTLIHSVEHEKIGEILNQADAFVMTSIQEGQPVSAMEAACCGLPVFSTRCGGVEDYIDEKMGRIFDITDSDGMAEALKEYLEGRIQFDAEYIRNTVVKKFGKEAFTRNFTEAFNDAIVSYQPQMTHNKLITLA